MKLFIMMFVALGVLAGASKALAEVGCDKLADGSKGQLDCSKLQDGSTEKAKCLAAKKKAVVGQQIVD